jgi:dCMP deaminase
MVEPLSKTRHMRISLKEIYTESAELWAKRTTCTRTGVGAVLVRDGRIVATGFNGAVAKAPHCTDVGCLLQNRDGRDSCIRTLHSPCYDCAKLLINAGISAVCYREAYSGTDGLQLLRDSGIKVYSWDECS